MDYLPPTACSDQYTDALTVGPSFACDHANIAVGANVSDVNAVLYQVAVGKVGDWRWTDEREFTAIPQTFKIGGDVVGVRFRNKTAGQVATVQCYLLGPKDPDIQPGTPYSQIPKITFEANDAAVAIAPTVDFEDSATIAWTLTDDAANQRVKVTAVLEEIIPGPLSTGPTGTNSARDGVYIDNQGHVWSVGVSGTGAFSALEPGDAIPRIQARTDGTLAFSDGSSSPDKVQVAYAASGTLSLSRVADGVGALQLGSGAGSIGYFYNNGGAGLRIASVGKLGFFTALPVAQPTAIFETAGFVQGSGTTVVSGSTFTGGVGATAYTLGDIVRCLKQLGLVAS